MVTEEADDKGKFTDLIQVASVLGPRSSCAGAGTAGAGLRFSSCRSKRENLDQAAAEKCSYTRVGSTLLGLFFAI